MSKETFKRLECFTEGQCKEIVERLLEMKEHFTPRSHYPDNTRVMEQDIDFWTMGTSTYLDLESAHGIAAHKTSQLMIDAFAEFYKMIIATLSAELNEPLFFNENYNIPGFHIFLGNDNIPRGIEYGGSIHRDYPHETSKFPFNFIRPITFTIMLEMPLNGASLNYWTDPDISNAIRSSKFENLDSDLQVSVKDKCKSLEYKIGELILHDGTTLHQVANMVETTKEDRRISIQGHGVLTNEGYLLYF